MSAIPAFAPGTAPRSAVKVLVADDSAVVRGLVSRWLGEAGHDVVATAPNGRAAVDALARCAPDVVLLDIEMPELDGIQALPLILARQPGVQVVMMSTLTQRNADVSLRCLSLGASTTSPSPRAIAASRPPTASGPISWSGSGCSAPPAPGAGPFPPRSNPPPRRSPRRPGLAPVRYGDPAPAAAHDDRPARLLIGSSTGGPKAVGEVLEKIGAATLRRLPVLIVSTCRRSSPPSSPTISAPGSACRRPRAKADERVQPGRIYVAPAAATCGCRAPRPNR